MAARVDALVQARDEGLTKAIGVTGHGVRIPSMHLRGLERFDFDSVLFPYNHSLMASDAYRADVEALLELCAERNVAVQTIKSIAKGRWTNQDEPHFSWYEPLTDAARSSARCGTCCRTTRLFLNTSSDARLLPMLVEAASGDLPAPSDDELIADERAVRHHPAVRRRRTRAHLRFSRARRSG